MSDPLYNNQSWYCAECDAISKIQFHNQHAQWTRVPYGSSASREHRVNVFQCVGCGSAIVEYIRTDKFKTSRRIVYPLAPIGKLAPPEIGQQDPELMKDYNEAVACRSCSVQASMVLLGRCVERILVNKADGEQGATLGPLIKRAIELQKIPSEWASSLEDGFVNARNMAVHVWQNNEGELLAVDDEMVDHGFIVVDWMFDHFCLEPAHKEGLNERLRNLKSAKLEGEKASRKKDHS